MDLIQSRNSNRQRRNNRQRGQSSETQVLRDIREELRNHLVILPRVRDVIPLKLARYRSFTFAITWDVATIGSSTTTNFNAGYYAALNALPGYVNMIECFDQYRILQVVYNFIPLQNPSVLSGGGGLIYTAIDYEDANTPSAHTDLEQQDTCMTAPFGEPFQRVVNPRISVAAYASGVFSSYATQRGTWIDGGSPGVQHYGLKVSVPAFGTSSYQYLLKGTCYIQMRSQV